MKIGLKTRRTAAKFAANFRNFEEAAEILWSNYGGLESNAKSKYVYSPGRIFFNERVRSINYYLL